LEVKTTAPVEKSFTESQLTMQNRTNLSITGVERVYETNENKIQLKVAGDNLLICGQDLNIARLDVDSGVVTIDGTVGEIKYISNDNKGNFFKKLFK